MMPCGELTTKLGRWVDGRIYFAGKRFLGGSEHLDDGTKRDLADDHHVHVALGALPTGGKRAKQERNGDPPSERLQVCAKHSGDARGLEQKTLEVGEHGAIRVGTVVDLVAVGAAFHDADGNESADFALHGPVAAGPGESNDLPQIERPVGVAEEQRQHRLPGLAKQGRGQRVEGRPGRRVGACSCTHI